MSRRIKLLLLVTLLFAGFTPFINVKPALSADIVITISTGVQTTTTLTDMVLDFNTNVASGFTVELKESTWETQNQHDTYVTKLAAKDSSLDIISMDVIWPPEFTAAGWLEPLDDIFAETGFGKDLFLEAPILAGTYKGKQYGLPWFHDSAGLYYRADILQYAFENGIIPANRAPETWVELRDWTRWMLANDTLVTTFEGTDSILTGFVWQGREYEGMICNFMEYLGGTGQYSFLDANDKPIWNTTEARETLEFMKSLITEVNITKTHADGRMVRTSPEAVLTYQEETSRAVWNAENAIFHRNWPYAYRLSMDQPYLNGSEGWTGVTGKGTNKTFGFAPMPAKDSTVTAPRTSCLGGWQLGLNIYSEHKAEAKIFMKWLTNTDQQRTYLMGGGQLPTRKALYSDSAVLADANVKYIAELYDVFTAALPRPVHPDYPAMSKAIWPALHTYLAGGYTLNEGTAKLKIAVEDVLEAGAPAGIPELVLLALFASGTLVILRKKRRI